MVDVAADRTVRRAPVLWRRSGDHVMIRRRGDDELVVLAGTGVALWLELSSPTTVADLIERLAAAHQAPAEVVGPDVREALSTLIDRAVVETA